MNLDEDFYISFWNEVMSLTKVERYVDVREWNVIIVHMTNISTENCQILKTFLFGPQPKFLLR